MITRPHGETNVTLACQNSCVGCNHLLPMQKPWFIDPLMLYRDLTAMAKIVHFDRYNLVGGEPTLHPEILTLLNIARQSGIADTLEITTNGQAYRNWSDELYQKIDELIVTPYKLTQMDLDIIADKCRQHDTLFQVHPVIFTECAFKEKSPQDIAQGRFNACWYNINRHVIDGGYFYRCCTAPFIPSVLLGLPKEHDGIAIEGLTEQALADYLCTREVPASCFVCASNMGNRIEWRENRDNWLNESVK